MNHTLRSLGLLLASSLVMLLAGCATPGSYGQSGPGYPSPGYPGTGYPSQGYPQTGSQWQGTVNGIDPRYGRIEVLVQDPRSARTQQVNVRYDQRTRLFYQGSEYPVAGLERGDVIRFDATPSGSELWARSIEVVRNVRDGAYGGGGYGDGYGSGNDMRGSVAFVDTRSRTIRLGGAGYGNDVQLAYDARTTVEYQGRLYRPENLQVGDIVRVQARQVGYGQWLAERIIVERSVGR